MAGRQHQQQGRRRAPKARQDCALPSAVFSETSSIEAGAGSDPGPLMKAAAAHQAPECGHVRAFAGAGGFSHLSVLLGVLFGSDRNARIRAPYCFACKLNVSRLHACLQCVYVGCWENHHIQEHAESRGHHLALELRGLHVFCFDCGDYVYDGTIEAGFRKHVPPEKLAPRELDSYNLIVSQEAAPPRLQAQRSVGYWHYSLRRDQHGFGGLRGMLNLGNTCFMNVVLQALVHNPPIRNFFLKDGHNRDQCSSHGDALCLGCDMDLIFEKAFHGETEPYAPHQFLCAMWSHASHLAGYEQQDAHEFLISLLDALHLRCGGTTSADCLCIVHRVSPRRMFALRRRSSM